MDNSLTEKIVEAIRRDVNNIFGKTASGMPLMPEHQEALVKYYKVLTDAKLAAKEQELEEKIKRVEELKEGLVGRQAESATRVTITTDGHGKGSTKV